MHLPWATLATTALSLLPTILAAPAPAPEPVAAALAPRSTDLIKQKNYLILTFSYPTTSPVGAALVATYGAATLTFGFTGENRNDVFSGWTQWAHMETSLVPLNTIITTNLHTTNWASSNYNNVTSLEDDYNNQPLRVFLASDPTFTNDPKYLAALKARGVKSASFGAYLAFTTDAGGEFTGCANNDRTGSWVVPVKGAGYMVRADLKWWVFRPDGTVVYKG